MGALDAASMGHMPYVNLWHAPEIALFIVVARHLVSPAARPAFVLLQAGCFCAVALTGLFGPYYLALEVLLALASPEERRG